MLQSSTNISTNEHLASHSQGRIIDGLAFDWVMLVLGTIFLGGLYLDGWAHNHGRVDNSFFTVWHAFFYSGFGLVALLLVGTLLWNRSRGMNWREALPNGYQLSLLGVFVFAAGGVGDLIWHELFGIEEDFEALISPTHLMLGAGLALIVSGPLRAALARPNPRPTWREITPALMATAGLISAFTFFMMFEHPLHSTVAGAGQREFYSDLGQVAGVTGLMITAALLMGPVLLLLRRWHLPPGSLTLIWGVNTGAMLIINYERVESIWMAAAMLMAAALADWLRCKWDIGPANFGKLHLFAFIAPALLFAAYFATLILLRGTSWSVHLVGGAIVLPGIVGWLLSHLAVE
ncbi:MAG: hypothetical protein R3A44_41830 [Caldilineaceae bacterium]